MVKVLTTRNPLIKGWLLLVSLKPCYWLSIICVLTLILEYKSSCKYLVLMIKWLIPIFMYCRSNSVKRGCENFEDIELQYLVCRGRRDSYKNEGDWWHYSIAFSWCHMLAGISIYPHLIKTPIVSLNLISFKDWIISFFGILSL